MFGIIVRFFLQQYLQEYNHLQPSESACFSIVGVILNWNIYLSKKSIYLFFIGLPSGYTYISTKLYKKRFLYLQDNSTESHWIKSDENKPRVKPMHNPSSTTCFECKIMVF